MKQVSQLLRDIEAEAALTRTLIGKDHLDPKVMEAMATVPREEFVPVESRAWAFDNGPIPIGCGQTISQPFIVALMTDMLAPQAGDAILEVGTGSGYQAAVLSLLVQRVFSIEIIPELAEEASSRLLRLGYSNVTVRQSDGYYGWPEHGPYDGIIVTAAAPEIPPPLFDQLKRGGKLVIPLGLPYSHQELVLVRKTETGDIETQTILGVAFVPLTGDLGRSDTGDRSPRPD